MPLKKMLLSGILLGLFAVIGTALVAYTYEHTYERIAQSQREALLRSLQALIPPELYDNDPASDSLTVTDPSGLGSQQPQQIYRARMQGRPVALAFTAVAPDGYSGDIHLLIAISYDGTLSGVRVTAHQETPGLGDKIETARSNWIYSFSGRSLGNPREDDWKVKKDGGIFDQFTGATVTPRAIVKAVHRALHYYQQHRDALFAESEEAGHG